MNRTVINWSFSLCLLFFFSLTRSSIPTHRRGPEGYAILIGVRQVDNKLIQDKHKLPDVVVFRDLPGTGPDVNKMYGVLKQEGFKDENIIRLGGSLSPTVSIQSILQALNTISRKVQKDDLFVFYFSGHGEQILDESGDEKSDDLDEALVTSNGFLTDDQINKVYRKSFMSTRNIMLIDACHAGTIHTIAGMSVSSGLSHNISQMDECNIDGTVLADENVNMIYLGASVDEKLAHESTAGGYFTQALTSVYNPFNWRTLSPPKAACMISKRMKNLQDPGKGEIQFTLCGALSAEFKSNYLFKIK